MPSRVVAAAILLVATTAPAAVPHRRAAIADELTALPAAGITRPLRVQRQVRFDLGGLAWQRLAATGTWTASWDAATGVPNRIWGDGMPAPGANASPAVAEQLAWHVLAEHLDLLAPGAALSDFELVSNHSDGEIRSIGFVQRAGNLRVVGGQVSFRFKRDRLYVIGSEALPRVVVATPRARLAPAHLLARATDALHTAVDLPTAPVTRAGDEVVLPLIADAGVLGYRIAVPFAIDGGAAGRYLAYVDPATGAVLAARQQNLYATGTLMYRGVDRYPGRGRVDKPARRAHITVGADPQTTPLAGVVTWTPDVTQTVTTAVVGDLVTIVNKRGALAAASLPLAPSGQAVWDASANGEDDAQVVTFLAIDTVKEFVRANLDPALATLDQPITANVNIDQSCNAYYDGAAVNFFHATSQCENTGLIEDVVYHEYGHSVHHDEIIAGVGAFDGAMSEGAADFLAASITGDPGMGRGLFYDDEPLRDLDPAGDEALWPKDIGEIHRTGLIFAGAFWDLRKAAIAALGQGPGVALTAKLYLAALRRATSIPASFIEALAADDDDGNLANGTPHECLIRDAFGRHGLRTATGSAIAPAILDSGAGTVEVRAELRGLRACASDTVTKATLIWVPGLDTPVPGTAEMMPTGPGTYTARMPLPVDSTVNYSVRVQFADRSQLALADNLGDPFYTLYNGPTMPLYCTSFDGDPFEDGWTTTASEGDSPWAWGVPVGGATDPPAAFTGSHVLGQNLAGDYPPKVTSSVSLPPIDVGAWSDVHLQFRRWLAVEDGHFDQARITVDGKQAWVNASNNRGDSSALHTIDREWRYEDIRISGFTFGHTLHVGFELASDANLAFGGWHIDDLCVVANVHAICGDGIKQSSEQCDDGDGNADAPGKCRTYCLSPTCGDGIEDPMEECDDGRAGSKRCTDKCKSLVAADAGCCGTGGGPVSLLFGLAVGATLLRRRPR